MDEKLSEQIDNRLDHFLRNFCLEEVLNDDQQHKTIFLKGKICLEGKKDKKSTSILILERPSFSLIDIKNILSTSNPKGIIENNIYKSMNLCEAMTTDAIKATLIYPATDKHVEKYRNQELFMIQETGDDYINITLPYILQDSFSLEWLYNILEKNSESERIVYEDLSHSETSFILLPDLKWTSGDLSQMYLVAIPHQRDIKSLRDLNQSHIELLENILEKSQEAIKLLYGIESNKLRIYVHYQPSYYHFHVHFTNINLESFGCVAGKAILLGDIIENIKMNSEYYRRKTMHFTVKKSDPLFFKFIEAGRI